MPPRLLARRFIAKPMPMLTLQFAIEAGLSSRLIRWFSHGPYTHVDVVLPEQKLLGARSDCPVNGKTGVQARPENYAKFVHVRRVKLSVTPSQEVLFYSFLKRQIGKPYDWRAILAFVFDRNWRNADAWYCSELVAAALEYAGVIPAYIYAPANKITPDDLLLILSALFDIEARKILGRNSKH